MLQVHMAPAPVGPVSTITEYGLEDRCFPKYVMLTEYWPATGVSYSTCKSIAQIRRLDQDPRVR